MPKVFLLLFREDTMALYVVEDSCVIDKELRNGKIVVESDQKSGSDALAELDSQEARQLALSYAVSKGVSGASINGIGRSYAATKEGSEITPDDARATPPKTVHRYRTEIPVIRKIF
jgi:hypothetical protein